MNIVNYDTLKVFQVPQEGLQDPAVEKHCLNGPPRYPPSTAPRLRACDLDQDKYHFFMFFWCAHSDTYIAFLSLLYEPGLGVTEIGPGIGSFNLGYFRV